MSDRATHLTPYVPRHFRSLGLWRIGNTQMKAYGITCDERALRADVSVAARAYCDAQRELIDEAPGGHALGYVIVHHGEHAVWLLAHWWAYGEIAMRLLASAPLATPTVFRSRDTDRFHACVWEHVVIAHERDAWVRHMLRPSPNADHYLRAELPDGPY
ncbi:MAG: hypothetical protein AAFX85_09920 [Pseudomonadota bacterium]